MDDLINTNVYILNYQKGEDQIGPLIYWSKDTAILDFFDIWLNSKKGFTTEMIREAWNSVVTNGTIPEVGEIIEAKFSDYSRGE